MNPALCARCHQVPPAPGLPRCAPCDVKRAKNAEHARQKREAARAALLVATPDRPAPTRCPARNGPGICGCRLEVFTRDGRTVVRCDWCERKAHGVCRLCSQPVAGRARFALYCATHKPQVHQEQIDAWAERHREELNEKARERYQTDEAIRRQRAEYKRAWRKANPDKVRKQKRREGLRQPKYLHDYQRRYRTKHRAYYAQKQRERYRAAHPAPAPRPCTTCGTLVPYEPPGKPYTKCDRCAWPCERRKREAKRARRAEQQAAAVQAPELVPATPKRVRVPRSKARTNAAGERLCVGPYGAHGSCATPVHGRTKKCAACHAHDRAAAAAALEPRAGRGRRTDREAREARAA